MNKYILVLSIVMLSYLGISIGASSVESQLHQSTQTIHYIDTNFHISEFSPKPVYNFNGKFNPSAVDFVELDTVNHLKKLWLSKKKPITPPPYSRNANIIANDSIVFVCFTKAEGLKYLNYVYSLDYGNSWSDPYWINNLGNSARSSLTKINSKFGIALTTTIDGETYEKIMYRSLSINTLTPMDSTNIHTAEVGSDDLYHPKILTAEDTLYVAYNQRDHSQSSYSINFKKSTDNGLNWVRTNDSVDNNLGGFLFDFVQNDTVLSVIYDINTEVYISRSYNGFDSWDEGYYLSDSTGFGSQIPSASGTGEDLHVVWYDHQDAPTGWEGWVFYRHTNDNGQTWSDIKSLSTYPNSRDVEIYSDSNFVYAVWNDSRLGSEYKAGYLRVSHDRGNTWSPEYKIIDDTEHPWEMEIYSDGINFYMVWKEQDAPEFIHTTYYTYGRWYMPGDVDGSGEIDIADLVDMVDWMFMNGEEPYPIDAAQIDGNTSFDVADLVGFVDYMFNNGVPPIGGLPNTEL